MEYDYEGTSAIEEKKFTLRRLIIHIIEALGILTLGFIINNVS